MMMKYCNHAGKSVFSKYLKNGYTYFDKTTEQNGIKEYKKISYREHIEKMLF